jgi:hypothetical protein
MVDRFIQVDLNTGKVEVKPDDGGFEGYEAVLRWLEDWVDKQADKGTGGEGDGDKDEWKGVQGVLW